MQNQNFNVKPKDADCPTGSPFDPGDVVTDPVPPTQPFLLQRLGVSNLKVLDPLSPWYLGGS